MTRRNTIAVIAGLCACWVWAFSAMAETPSAGKASLPSKPVRNNFAKSSIQSAASKSAETPRDRAWSVSSVAEPVIETWYPVNPAPPGTEQAGLRGGSPPAECVFEPCETAIYRNDNISGFSVIVRSDLGTDTSCDDVSLVGTDRFLCSVLVNLGGLAGSGDPDSATLTLHSGNQTPNCPDDPGSALLYSATKNYPLNNPGTTVTFDISPPLLVDENFLWVCITSSNVDSAWSIAGNTIDGGDVGSTVDSFLRPNNDGTCGGQDYRSFGGNPYSGMAIEIRANPGPPGACCNRDVVPAVCTDDILRANCVNNLVNIWKEGLCADFDDTNPVCTSCITLAEACAGATTENEPSCGAGYQDSFNSGCLADNVGGIISFSPISCGAAVCGFSGNYQSFCTQDSECASGVLCVSNVCNGENDSRDNDWYELTLTAEREVTWTVTSRFPYEMSLMNNGGDDETCTFTTRQIVAGKACETKTITECLPAGAWWLRVRPSTFLGIPCNSAYRISVACASPCAEPLVYAACCDASEAGCFERPEKACTPRGGTWLGSLDPPCNSCADTCADVCPGVPVNDECIDKLQLTGVAVMKTFDTSFATDTDFDATPGTPDTPPTCSVGAPPNPQPQMREDIFYNYTIPTNLAGVAYNAAILSISMAGSEFDGFIAVYGDVGGTAGTQVCNCTDGQIECNDDILFNSENPFSFNAAP
ncbi:MAG TPA: hypothetical protein VJZ71_06970, partial [Phycisphaerae bacterium]|nr:hypothetical protein [Phycisphaerae bacterium]